MDFPSTGSRISLKTIRQNQKKAPFCGTILIIVGISSFVLSFCLLNATANPQQKQQQQPQSSSGKSSDLQQQDQGAALEAELNSIVQQHDAIGSNNKLLAAAIISRLMVDNLTGSSLSGADASGFGTNDSGNIGFGSDGSELSISSSPESSGLLNQEDQTGSINELNGSSSLESAHLRRLLNSLRSYEPTIGGGGSGGQVYGQYPILPSSQAATMKRAVIKTLQQQQQQQLQQRLNGYGRNSFDFGLGKRPDRGISGNILRFGDSLGVNGGAQAIGQFGKRPSAHRYDFGLGKRVASPSYPRYDFGLGKRAPSRIRYDFGLGK